MLMFTFPASLFYRFWEKINKTEVNAPKESAVSGGWYKGSESVKGKGQGSEIREHNSEYLTIMRRQDLLAESEVGF